MVNYVLLQDALNQLGYGAGWSPVIANVADGARIVQKITNWINGAGTKPPVNVYLSQSGFTTDIAQATDIRGPAGGTGSGAIFSLSGNTTVAEGNSGTTTATYTVTRSGSTSGTGSVDFAVSGTGVNPASGADFVGGVYPVGTVNFAAGDTSKTFQVNILPDTAVESDETYIVTISNAGTGNSITTATVTTTITNDDAAPVLATLSITPNTATQGQSVSISIVGATSSSTITGSMPAGLTLNSASRTITGTPTSTGTLSFNLVETLAGATGSPKTTSVTLTVTASSARVQNVASGMQMLGYRQPTASNGTDTAFNGVIYRVNESGATVGTTSNPLRISYPGWTRNSSNESDMNGNLSVWGSIEYPIGSARSGAPMTTVTPGSNTETDGIVVNSGAGIPPGAVFGVWTHGEAAAGVIWPTALTFQTNTNKDAYETGAAGTLANKYLTGTITGNANGYHPNAINCSVSGGKKVVLAIIGDSIAAGQGDIYIDAANNAGYGRAATGKCPVLYSAVSGNTANLIKNRLTSQIDWFAKAGVTHVQLEPVTNDLANGTTPSASLNLVQLIANAIIAGIPGIKIVPNTVQPRTTTTNAYDQYEGLNPQTVIGGNFTAGTGSGRNAYNDLIRANPSPFFDYLEFADTLDADANNVITRGGGFWKTGLNAPYMVAPSNAVVQASPAPTTTTFTTDVIKTNNYFGEFGFGKVKFTSGALSGNTYSVASSGTTGNVTISPALPSAPAAGDNCILAGWRSAAVIDGIHNQNTDNTGSLGGLGPLRNVLAAKIDTWNA